jgi:ParB family chromosome partitioning protein
MYEAGAGVEELAICFGVSELTVQRRLKLANVSPRLFDLFRDDKLNLEQLMALSLCDDHAAQERVWDSTPAYNRHASALRRLLLGREVDASDDPLAKFVTLATYEAAGGAVTRDLFAESDCGYIRDVELLQRLTTAKLDTEAAKLKAEGWGWVEGRTQFDHAERNSFAAAPVGRCPPTTEQAAKLASLAVEQQKAEDALEAMYDAEDDDSFDQKEGAALERASEKARAAIQSIERKLCHWTPEVMALAGSVVTVDGSGALALHRGLVRLQDRKAVGKAIAASSPPDAGAEVGKVSGDAGEVQIAPLAESLVRKLTSHRTKALQVMVAGNMPVALAVLAHSMLQSLVIEGIYRPQSASSVRASTCDHALKQHADDMGASAAWLDMKGQLDNLREHLPGDPAKLLAWLIAQPQDTVL